ncbi:hypothetical protein [Paraliomyxa miuraensis]|uniref:hypothetical protein n=1 Tax=Paraliomyxa miuraensis TaxID=376150 RepID=UPI00224EC17A|nr:hypothetical protein [Paraliomyxa miuraensis]MCX4241117.1 hypothetical protein [Paraliomyxa miuraensis]
MSSNRERDAEKVRHVLRHELKVHVRLQDQNKAPTEEQLQQLADTIPDVMAFGDNSFIGVRAVLDWDHQIPSKYALLRILACYRALDLERLDALIEDRDEEIAEGNLYPEFDVPDYGDLDSSESYVALMTPGSVEIEDFRFMSAWRKQVRPAVADLAVETVKNTPSYQRAAAARSGDGLGGPVVIGWAPPCLANTSTWAVEIWLLTEFDGHQGKARVFMVDLDEKAVTREFDTDVQLA